MDVQKYLDRICFEGKIEISLACLTKLQHCHQLNVPFENLDVFTNRKKVLKVEVLYEQIVTQHRGGWCHELNGLYSWLLRTLGFNVKIISANYFNPEKREFQGDYDHMTLVVRLAEQDYMSDVGFGNITQPFDPIWMTPEAVSVQPGGLYKLTCEDSHWHVHHQERDVEGHHNPSLNKTLKKTSWQTIFRFDQTGRELEEFQPRCDEYQTDKENCSLAAIPVCINKAENGSVVNILRGRRFTSVKFQHNSDIRTNQLDLNNEEYDGKLKTIFGIKLNTPLDIENVK